MSLSASSRQESDGCTDPLDQLDFDPATGRRAVYEALELTPLGDGRIEVVNRSHPADEQDAHAYTVRVRGGVPVDCDCPDATYRDGACKHQIRAAVSPSVLRAAGEDALMTDGGRDLDADEPCLCETSDGPGCFEHFQGGDGRAD